MDLWRFYSVRLDEVALGKGPHPKVVLRLAQGLPDVSLTVALASGGRDHYGWGVDRHMAADLYDAVNANTRATGNWQGKPPKFPAWPRPTSKPGDAHKASRPTSVADIYARLAGKV